MITGLQLALTGGGLVGLGVTLLVWRLAPAEPDLADAIHRTVSFGVGRKNTADDAPVDDPLFADPAWRAVPASSTMASATCCAIRGLWVISTDPASGSCSAWEIRSAAT